MHLKASILHQSQQLQEKVDNDHTRWLRHNIFQDWVWISDLILSATLSYKLVLGEKYGREIWNKVGKLETKVSMWTTTVSSEICKHNAGHDTVSYQRQPFFSISNSNLADGTHTHLYLEIIQQSLQCRTVLILGRCISWISAESLEMLIHVWIETIAVMAKYKSMAPLKLWHSIRPENFFRFLWKSIWRCRTCADV